ncbi:hypothetical protein F5Y10DRAFT_292889 [Nemania abortiva]|nr:hypothetical protein F5Y10DRAFT_292889 [Nemania abortiva]
MGPRSVVFDPHLADENTGQQTLILAILFIVLISLSTGTRVCSRLWLSRKLGLDDFLILTGLAFNLTGNALEVLSVHSGYGRHLQFLTSEQRSRTRMYTLILIPVASVALWSIKMSISYFLLQLITGVHQWARWILYALMAITTATSLLTIIVWFLQTQPLEKAWHPEIPGKVSSPRLLVAAYIASTVLGSVTDLFYALSPIYFFGHLQMALRRKVLLISLTGCGLIVFALAVANLAFVPDFLNPDYSWALHRLFILSLLERNLAEIIANLPATAPLFRIIYKRTQDFSKKYHQGSGDDRGTSFKRYPISSIRTIGSPFKGLKPSTVGWFRSYGMDAQLTDLDTTRADDQVELRSDLPLQRPFTPISNDHVSGYSAS